MTRLCHQQHLKASLERIHPSCDPQSQARQLYRSFRANSRTVMSPACAYSVLGQRLFYLYNAYQLEHAFLFSCNCRFLPWLCHLAALSCAALRAKTFLSQSALSNAAPINSAEQCSAQEHESTATYPVTSSLTSNSTDTGNQLQFANIVRCDGTMAFANDASRLGKTAS